MRTHKFDADSAGWRRLCRLIRGGRPFLRQATGHGAGPHVDGWGVLYEGKGCRTFKDPVACAQSQIARLVQEYPIKSCAVVSHIRQANRGSVALENTHPFTRELWGRYWTFAHNGQLTNYESPGCDRFEPVGQTDSEKVILLAVKPAGEM